MRGWFNRLVGAHAMLYRPTYIAGIMRDKDGYFIPNYGVRDLRARLFGVRVPTLWAIDRMIVAGRLR